MNNDITSSYRLLFNLLYISRKEMNNPSFEISQLCILAIIELTINPHSLLKRTTDKLVDFYNKNSREEFSKLLTDIEPSHFFVDYNDNESGRILLSYNNQTHANLNSYFVYLAENQIEITNNTYKEILKFGYEHLRMQIISPISRLKNDLPLNSLINSDIFVQKNSFFSTLRGNKEIEILGGFLVKFNFISESDLVYLQLVLQGKISEKVINWRRDASSLKFLIETLIDKNLIIPLKNKWKVTSDWFIVEGQPINRLKFRKLHHTKDCIDISKIYELIDNK